MKKLRVLIGMVTLFISGAYAQIERPVKWSYASKKINEKEAFVFIKATIAKGWHIYSTNLKEGGPVRTSFTFSKSPAYLINGKIVEPKPITRFESSFGMNVSYFENEVIFRQKVGLRKAEPTVRGTLEFMVCNDHKCLPPEDVDFKIVIK